MLRTVQSLLLAAAMSAGSAALASGPVSTAFTYQGLVQNNGQPLSGPADVQFTLFDAATGGSQVGSTVSQLALTPGQGGLVNLSLDFGSAAFNGNARWLQIAVRSPAGSGTYTTLTTRQPLTATPYAMYALNAGNTFWTASAGNITNTNSGFVGINRSTPVTGFDVFSVKSNTTAGYGGMYVQTSGNAGQPFYGYSVNGGVDAYSYVDGADGGKWKLAVGNSVFTVTPSGQVGVNNTAPSQAMDVNGTVQAADFAYAAPATCYYMIGEADFRNRAAGDSVSCNLGNGGAAPPSSSPWGIIAPIHLPQGATITNVRIWYLDNDSAANLTAELDTHDSTGGYNFSPSVSSGGVSANVRFMDIAAPGVTIDNTTHDYSLAVVPSGLSGVWGSNMVVENACVTYTIAKPAP